jgi:hypothetical protein
MGILALDRVDCVGTIGDDPPAVHFSKESSDWKGNSSGDFSKGGLSMFLYFELDPSEEQRSWIQSPCACILVELAADFDVPGFFYLSFQVSCFRCLYWFSDMIWDF